MKKINLLSYIIFIILLLAVSLVKAQKTASVSGAWSNTATWGGQTPPTSTDAVIINPNVIVTVDGANTCASLTIKALSTNNTNNGIIISNSNSLTVTGAITMTQQTTYSVSSTIAVGAGTLNAASIFIPGNYSSTQPCLVSASTGTINVTGNITFSGDPNAQLTFTGAGTLNIGGTLSSGGTFTAATSTVNFNGSNQTIQGYSYYNLILSGNGTDVLQTGSIGGNLSLRGTVSASTTAVLSIGGNLSIGDGTSLTVANTFTVSGTTTVGGGTSGALYFSLANNMYFVGLVTINARANWTENAAITPWFSNGIINNGSFTANTGAHFFQTNDQTISGIFTMSVQVNSINLTNNGTLTANTLYSTGNGSLINAANSTLNINYGGGIGLTLIATANGNTVNYEYAGAQTIFGTNYYNLILSGGSYSKYFSPGTTFINGTLTISATGEAQVGSGNITTNQLVLGGVAQVPGKYGYYYSGNSYFMIQQYYVIVSSGCTLGTWTGTTSTDWNTGSNWCNGIIPASTTDVIIPSGTLYQPTIGLAGGLCHNINSSAILTITSSLTVYGNWTNNGTLTIGSGTVTFNGSSAQTIGGSSSTTFCNLNINKSSGTTTLSLNQTVTGNLTITSGTLDLGTYTVNRSTSGGTLTIAGTLRLSGTTGGQTGSNFPLNYTTNTLTGGTVEYYNAIGGQAIYSTPIYNNLMLSNTSGTNTITSNLTVNGTFTTTSGGNLLVNCGVTITTNGVFNNYANITGPTIQGLYARIVNANFIANSGSRAVIGASSSYLVFSGSITNSSGGSIGINVKTSSSILPTCSPLTVVTITPSQSTICNGSTLTLNTSISVGTGTLPFIYSWSCTPNTFSSASSSPTVSPTITTTYTVTVTDANNISVIQPQTIVVNPLPTVSAARSVANICNGSSVLLSANAAAGTSPYTYAWSAGAIPTTSVTPSATVTANTTYSVSITDSKGCSATSSITVGMYSLPTITVNGSSICIGASQNITASGATSYTWSNSLGSGNTKTVSPTTSTTYNVTGTDVNGCSNTANAIVTINLLPTVTVSGGSICIGSSMNITANGANTYTWSNNLGNGNTKTVSPTISTTYTVTGTDINGCINTANSIVTVNSNPTAYAGKKQITCPGVSLTLNATGGTTYLWSTGSTLASATVIPTITSTYTVTVSNASNCSASSSVVVVVATTLYSNNTGSWNTDNDWDFTVAPAPCNDVVINYGNTVDLTNISGRCNNLTVLGKLNIDGTSTLTCSGKVFNGSTGIINLVGGISGAYYDFTTPGNTVVYSNTSSDQSVIPVKYHHLTIQNFGYTATMISNDNDTVNGNLMINGTLQSTSQNLFIGGNFINNGNFIHNNGKVTFNGNTLYTGSSITTFNNVDVAPGKLLTIDGNGKTMKVLKNIYIKATDAHNIGQLAIADNSSKLIGAGETDSVFVQIYDTLNNWHYQAAPLYNGYMGAMALRYYYGKSFNEITNTYVAVTGYDSLQAGKGYTIRFNPTLLSEFKRLTTFSGPISKLHTGTITLPVTNTVGKGDGWNLVGNPYPSAIDWEAANGWHNTNIDPTVYVYDSYHHSYATYNSNTHTGTNGGTRYIPSMQGFYVHCAANGLWSMDNRVRIAYNQPFWKGEEISTSDFSNQVRLLINGNNFSDETMIAFGNEATNGFDDMLDAYKLFSPEENVPQINSKTLENNSVKVAVNNLPVSKMYNSIVPVEITTGVGGKYTITAKNLTIDPTVDVTLEDLKTKTFTDLRSSSYIFTTDVVSNENRFNVLFGARPTTIKEINTENISIYTDHSQIVIKNYSGSTEKSLVTVYDILGKQITEKNIEPNTTSIIDINSSIAQSIYFVKVVTENKTLTKKICITR